MAALWWYQRAGRRGELWWWGKVTLTQTRIMEENLNSGRDLLIVISQSCSIYFYRLNKQENDSPHVCYCLEIYSCLPHVQDTVMMGSEYYTLLWCTIFIRFLKIFRFQYLNTSLGSGEWAWIDPKQSVSNMDRSNCMVRLRSLDMSMSSHCRFSRLCQPVLPAVVLSDQANHFLTFVISANR